MFRHCVEGINRENRLWLVGWRSRLIYTDEKDGRRRRVRGGSKSAVFAVCCDLWKVQTLTGLFHAWGKAIVTRLEEPAWEVGQDHWINYLYVDRYCLFQGVSINFDYCFTSWHFHRQKCFMFCKFGVRQWQGVGLIHVFGCIMCENPREICKH